MIGVPAATRIVTCRLLTTSQQATEVANTLNRNDTAAQECLPYASMRANIDPYYSGDWRRAPYEARPYISITEHVMPEDNPDEAALLRWKFTTQGADRCGAEFFSDHAASMSLDRWCASRIVQGACG